MFKQTAGRLVEKALKHGYAKPENLEEYIYGVNAFLTMLVNILSAVIIGILMHMLAEMVIYVITYKSLRKYVGGGHSKTQFRCYISSCMTYITALLLVKYWFVPFPVTMTLMLLSAVVLMLISPVEAEKKPLDELERKVFGKRARITILVIVCVYLMLALIQGSYYCTRMAIVVAVSAFSVTAFALEGKMHLLRVKRQA